MPTETDVAFDSRTATLMHARRVAELMAPLIAELTERAISHDQSKLEEPELAVFDEFTPKLAETTYGSEAYKENLRGMGPGLAHHYAAPRNRHHPEHFGAGVDDMTLLDLLENARGLAGGGGAPPGRRPRAQPGIEPGTVQPEQSDDGDPAEHRRAPRLAVEGTPLRLVGIHGAPRKGIARS